MEPVKTSSFQLPNGATVETVYVRLADGRIVPRHPDELLKRPTPPAVPR
jgi:hypothetical protein